MELFFRTQIPDESIDTLINSPTKIYSVIEFEDEEASSEEGQNNFSSTESVNTLEKEKWKSAGDFKENGSTPACKIPILDPFHPHVSSLQNDVGTNLREICRSMYSHAPIFRVENNKLVLKDDFEKDVALGVDFKSIKLRGIERLNDEDFKYLTESNPFGGLSNLNKSNDIGHTDFFRVDYTINKRRASDLYARVSPKSNVRKKQDRLAKKFKSKGLNSNVLIIGIDSTSRANFVRKLPRVKSFLETRMHTYFMKGMSIVGDATTPVLTAMLTGKDVSMLPEGRASHKGYELIKYCSSAKMHGV